MVGLLSKLSHPGIIALIAPVGAARRLILVVTIFLGIGLVNDGRDRALLIFFLFFLAVPKGEGEHRQFCVPAQTYT